VNARQRVLGAAFAEHSKRPSFFSIKESNSEIFEISLR
jgi:hypothetical protein